MAMIPIFKNIRLAYLDDLEEEVAFEGEKNKVLAPHIKHFDKAKKHKSLLDDIIDMAEAKGDTEFVKSMKDLQQDLNKSIKEGDEAAEAYRKIQR